MAFREVKVEVHATYDLGVRAVNTSDFTRLRAIVYSCANKYNALERVAVGKADPYRSEVEMTVVLSSGPNRDYAKNQLREFLTEVEEALRKRFIP